MLTSRAGVGIKGVNTAVCSTSVRCDNDDGGDGFFDYKEAPEGLP